MSSKKHGRKEALAGFTKYRVKPKLTSSAIRDYLESLDCPRALAVWLLFENNEHAQLVEMDFDPAAYNDLRSFRDAYMATMALSKYEDLSLDLDLDQVAFAKFRETETRCRLVNNRFRHLSSDPNYQGRIVWLHHAVAREIDKILGDFSYEEMLEFPDWGPGASTQIKRRDASPAKKFQSETGITRDLYTFIPECTIEESFPLWFVQLKESGYPAYSPGNKVITVPKNAKTNRVIAVEPGLNLFFQKAIGEMIRQRLLRFGVDLRHQERNQLLARLGSKTSELATVDFSSASDTISRAVVEELIPEPWYQAMDACRSKYGELEGKLIRWEKFSSMGNGFTFPLETLIFYACAKACAEYVGTDLAVSAYGDDVIIPTSCFELYSELVSFYGFSVNPSKSFSTGCFRESCGAHYYSGFDVKPVYIRRRLERIDDVYRLYNALRRLAKRSGFGLGCDARYKLCVENLIRAVPKALRLRIPDGLGEGGFIGNFDEATPVRMRHWVEGYQTLTYCPVGVTHSFEQVGYHLATLWALSKRLKSDDEESVRPITYVKATRKLTELDTGEKGRNSVSLHRERFTLTKTYVRQWTNLGPWVTLD